MPIPEAVEAPRSTARWAASLPSPALACVLFGGTALVILCDWFGVGDRGFVDFAGAVRGTVQWYAASLPAGTSPQGRTARHAISSGRELTGPGERR